MAQFNQFTKMLKKSLKTPFEFTPAFTKDKTKPLTGINKVLCKFYILQSFILQL